MNFESDTSAYNDGYENGQDECKQRVREVLEKHSDCIPTQLCEHGDKTDDFCYHIIVEDLDL